MFLGNNDAGADRPIAEKIRRHFMNQNAYRQPKIDIDSDSSSDEYPDLSASFEQILHERRPDLQKKTNGTPSKSTMAAPHKQQQQQDADTSTMNRLFVHCDLNAADGSVEARSMLEDVDEPSMFERLSPCKRVGLLRPSTVLEDSSGEEEEEEEMHQQEQQQQQEEADDSTLSVEYAADGLQAETSFGTAATFASAAAAAAAVHETSFETARTSSAQKRTSVLKRMSSAAFTRDSLAVDGDSQDEDSLNELAAPSQNFDDTLEVVEYDQNAPRYVLKPVRKSNAATAKVATPQRSHKPSAYDADAVIVVESDSSPETSFHTARSNPATVKKERSLFPQTRSFYADDSLDEMAQAAAAATSPGCEVISLNSDSEEDENEEAEADDARVVAAEELPSVESHSEEVYEADSHTTNTSETSSIGPSVSRVDNRDAADVDSALDESLALHANIPDEFNDTIERMDYLMELGRRIQQKQLQSASKVLPTSALAACPSPMGRASPRLATSVPSSCNTSACKNPPSSMGKPASRPAALLSTNTPRPAASSTASPATSAGAASKKLFRTPVTKASPILKAKPLVNSPAKFHQPSTPVGGVFKKPTLAAMSATASSGGAGKKTPLQHSRIPKARSATKYDYVVSPIGAYISKIAPNPMQQNVVIERDFLDSTYCAGASKELDFTLPAANAENVPPTKSRLPKKAYMQAERTQIIDKRHLVCPGGSKIQNLIGTTPLVVVHHGQYTTSESGREPQLDVDDSFLDMSLAVGDLSVKVVQNTKR